MSEPLEVDANKPLALVVDDDPLVRRALVRQLHPEFRVREAGSQAEALRILTEYAGAEPSRNISTTTNMSRVVKPGTLALAFVDFELPDGTGEPVLRRLEAWPNAIRVLMSANVAEMHRFRSCGSLVAIVLDKPLAPSSIEAAKRAALSLPAC